MQHSKEVGNKPVDITEKNDLYSICFDKPCVFIYGDGD
jgi:hypothetical protein